jgi:hypothetical protein
MTLRRDGVEPGATGVDFVLPDAARLSLRLVDARSGRPLAPSHGWFAATVVRRPTGTSEFEDADGWMDADGVVAVSVLRGLPFDVGIAPSGAGFRSVTLEGLVVDGDERTIDVPLEPGFAVRVHARADEGAEPMREPHVLFLLRPGEQQLLDGPFTDVGIEFHAVGPFSIRTSDTRLLRRSLHTRGTVGGLEPGTYFLHAIPDDLVFEPATVTLDQSDDGAEIEFRWRPR